jgi:nuclear migration protein JNM1
MQGLTELRGRFEKLSLARSPEGSKTDSLVKKVVGLGKEPTSDGKARKVDGTSANDTAAFKPDSESRTIGEIDRRLGELEKLIGASSTSLEEVGRFTLVDTVTDLILRLIQTSPLPQPLLPHITRLSNLLALLTQPRHIDSISRRLKLLLTDLERYSTATNKRQAANQQPSGAVPVSIASGPSHELAPVLNRIAPALPTIPHLLARLRTLSTLHASASSFVSTLSQLEEEQKKFRNGLEDLDKALRGVEKSFEVNTERMENNLKGLQSRLDVVQTHLGVGGRTR